MKHAIEIDLPNRTALVRYHGAVTIEELEELFARMIALPGWEADFARLIFYDGGEFGDFTVERMDAMLKDIQTWRQDAFPDSVPPTAHVCADEVKRIFVKHWLAVIHGEQIGERAELFETEAAARAWIEAQRAAE
jgi:hypothetical protein